MRFPMHQVKKTGANKAIKMKQVSPKRRKKPSISESISFVIKGKLSPMKSMITREMKYRRTSTRGTKKEVEECKVEDKLRIGCGMKVESEMITKKKGGKQSKATGESLKHNTQKDKSEENTQKTVKKNKSKRKSAEADKEISSVKRGRKTKTESPLVKKEIVNSKKSTAKVLRESVSKKNIKKLSPKVKTTKESPKVSQKTDLLKNKTKIKKLNKKKESESNDNDKVKTTDTVETTTSEPENTLNLLPEKIKVEDDVKQGDIKLESKKKQVKKPANKQKLKYKATPMLIKKPIILKNKAKKQEKQPSKKPKAKLMSLWNGPKRHRVASLNALAKVHCLYENESRSAILDNLETIKSETSSSGSSSSKEDEIPITRTLRSVPGLRAIGKHWDMDEGTFSSSDESSYDTSEKAVVARKPKIIESVDSSNAENKADGTGKKRRRNRTEIIMDLKDMVVRKRMASLNATAILAASYSMERRCLKSPKCEDTDYDSDDGIRKLKEKKKPIEEVTKQEDDKNVIEVCASPNKKVSVILNQDTDVTITGVYLNSTTRSTHHEGYCSIAGMQYRISATSHTQTAATAVATETILQPSGNGAGQDNVSRKRPIRKLVSRCILRCCSDYLTMSLG